MSRRSHYRVRTQELPVVLRLVSPGRPAVPIRVDDLTIQGALIRIPSEERPLEPGEVVRIEVIGLDGPTLPIQARVVRQEGRPRPGDERALPAYGVLFLEPSAIEARLTPTLAPLFNRRRVPRVPGRFGRGALQVLLAGRTPQGEEVRWAVGVRDLSCDALGLEAIEPADPFHDGDSVVARLRLPGDDGPIELSGALWTRPEGAGSRMVVRFHRVDAHDDARQRLSAFTAAARP